MTMPTIDQLRQRLEDSQDFMDKVTTGFLERNERIFYRKPTVNSEGQMEYADLVDNTLASYLEKMPKNVIQKFPTFTVDAHTQNKAEDLVYEYIANKVLMRSGSSDGYSLLQKHWITLRNAGTFGACAVYLPFVNDHGEFSVGFEYIYWGDLYPEAYANNLNRTNFTQFRTMKTKGDLEAILAGLDDEKGGSWDKAGIQTVIDYGEGQSSGKDNRPLKVQMQGLPDEMFELFVYTDANWVIYWHYASETILRVIPNRSGRKRVVALYSDYDGSSIMGRSLVDMAFAAQQGLTSLLRGFIYTADYNTDPAKFVKGVNLDEDNFDLVKGNTMFLNDEDGNVTLLPTDTTTVQNFPNLYSLMKTVLLTSLPSSSDSGISAEVGDPTYSKTQAGVNDQREKADVDNNYYRKNYEQFFEMVLENQINIYVAEIREWAKANNIVPTVKLDEEYAGLVREELGEEAGKFISDKNEVPLGLDDIKSINVSVNFETTRQLAKEEDLQRLNTFMTGMFEVAKASPVAAEALTPVIPLLMQEMTKSSNLENSSKISKVMEEALAQAQEKAAAAEQQAQEQTQGEQDPMAEVKPPTVSISFKDLPPAGKIQAAAFYGIELTPEDLGQQVQEEVAVAQAKKAGGAI